MAAPIQSPQVNQLFDPFAAKMAARKDWEQSFERDIDTITNTIADKCLGIVSNEISKMLTDPWRPNCIEKAIPCDFVRAPDEFRFYFGTKEDASSNTKSFKESTFERLTQDLSEVDLDEVDTDYYLRFVDRVANLAVQKIAESNALGLVYQIDGHPTGWRYDIGVGKTAAPMQNNLQLKVTALRLTATLVKREAAAQKA